MAKVISPVSGKSDAYHHIDDEWVPSYFDEGPYRWFLTEAALNLIREREHSYHTTYSPEELEQGWLIVRSRIWRAKTGKQNEVCVILSDEQKTDLASRYLCVEFGECLREALSISFAAKRLETLKNIAMKVTEEQPWVEPPYQICVGQKLEFRHRPMGSAREDGMAYGCDQRTAMLVYQSLQKLGWIQEHSLGNELKGWCVSPDGEELLEEAKAHVNPKQAFLVRRWREDRDQFFGHVHDNVLEKIGVSIEAVWDRPHNDKIDERIMRLIRESAAVVVDVVNDKFNVGFEVGYALALGKPIIAIREKRDEGKTEPLPFDIATLNCHDYNSNDLADLVDKLSEKLLVAIPTARHR